MKYLAFILILSTCKEKTMTFTLQGSKSGDIVITNWRQISGDTSKIANLKQVATDVTVIRNEGERQYEITGISNKDSIYKDTVKITIIK